MGWCSGTTVFDRVAKAILECDASEDTKVLLLCALTEACEDHDWDCQDDSVHYDHPLVQRAFFIVHPNWDWLIIDD